MRRLLITGGGGYLGQHLVPIAARQFDLIYTIFRHDPFNLPIGRRIDLRVKEPITDLVEKFNPQVIIHTAGSNRTPDMDSVIRQGTAHVVSAAERVGARLIHFSSDALFNGRAAPYRESDPPSPIHAYGRAKAKAEDFVSHHPNHVIVRTSLIYGLSLMDHSTAWIKAALEAGDKVVLFDDQLRQPTWASTLALACLELAESDFQGVLNIAGSQVTNRAEFGLKLLDWWGVTTRDTLAIGSTGDQWPSDTRLDLTLAEEVLNTPLLGLDNVLDAYAKK